MPTGDARRVFKLCLDADDARKQRYVIETRVAGSGRLGVFLMGLKSPDRVMVSASSSRATLSSEEFVVSDQHIERELVEARAIRVVRVEQGEAVYVIDDGSERSGAAAAVVGGVNASAASAAPAKNDAAIIGMLSGIMKGASPRIKHVDGPAFGEDASGARASPATSAGRTTMLTPRSARGGQTAAAAASRTSGGAQSSIAAAPSGEYSSPSALYSSTFSSGIDTTSSQGGVDDYIESMMSDFAGLLTENGVQNRNPGSTSGLPPGFTGAGSMATESRLGSAYAQRSAFGALAELEQAPPLIGGHRELSPFFASSDAASGALEGALESGVNVAPIEDTSLLRAGMDEVDMTELTSEDLGFGATPGELKDMLNRTALIDSIENDLMDYDETSIVGAIGTSRERRREKRHNNRVAAGTDKPAEYYEAGAIASRAAAATEKSHEICDDFNLRGNSFECDGHCGRVHACKVCESPQHPFGRCPQLAANINKRVASTVNNVCVDYYLNSVDDTGGALRTGWDQDNHTWNLCPRGKSCTLPHVCGSCGKEGTNAHLASCRLSAVFSQPKIDICRKYYLHSLGDYFKMEGDGAQKFKLGNTGGWNLCSKGDRCHSRHICGHCGSEGRGKHTPECKLYPLCGVVHPADKQPCFLYYMKSLVGIREFEKGLLSGSAKSFCSQKKGECTGHHVCGSCGNDCVSPYNSNGHASTCRMRTIANEVDPTLDPRTKQLLKDYQEELQRLREEKNALKEAKNQSTSTEELERAASAEEVAPRVKFSPSEMRDIKNILVDTGLLITPAAIAMDEDAPVQGSSADKDAREPFKYSKAELMELMRQMKEDGAFDTPAGVSKSDDKEEKQASNELDPDEVVKVDSKTARVLKSEIVACLRGIEDDVELTLEDAIASANKSIKRSENPSERLKDIREKLRPLSNK